VRRSHESFWAKDDGDDRVFLRPRPLVNPLIARWRFLERLVANDVPAGKRCSGNASEAARFHERVVQPTMVGATSGRKSLERVDDSND
jgi:hypothetical protein